MAVRPSVTFFFNKGKQGWSERWYYTTNATLSTVATAGAALLIARSKMLVDTVTIPWAFASYDDALRDVFPVATPSVGPTNIWNSALNQAAAQPNECIVARLFSNDRGGKFTYLSGIPNDITDGDDLYDPNIAGPWDTAFLNWVTVLVNGNWGWKGVETDPAQAVPTAISAITVATSTMTVTVASVAGFTPGKMAKIYGATFTGPPGIRPNRNYTVQSVNGGALTVTLNVPANKDYSDVDYVGGGFLQPIIYKIYTITACQADKLGTRKRGAGFGQPAGRRKSK